MPSIFTFSPTGLFVIRLQVEVRGLAQQPCMMSQIRHLNIPLRQRIGQQVSIRHFNAFLVVLSNFDILHVVPTTKKRFKYGKRIPTY